MYFYLYYSLKTRQAVELLAASLLGAQKEAEGDREHQKQTSEEDTLYIFKIDKIWAKTGSVVVRNDVNVQLFKPASIGIKTANGVVWAETSTELYDKAVTGRAIFFSQD